MNVPKTSASSLCCATSSRLPWLPVLILLACMSAPACSKRGTVRTEGVPPEVLELLTPLPRFDPALLQPSPAQLPEAASDDVITLTRNHVEATYLYHDLNDKHAGLAAQARQRELEESARIERARAALRRERKWLGGAEE